jgi:hypothetical protein
MIPKLQKDVKQFHERHWSMVFILLILILLHCPKTTTILQNRKHGCSTLTSLSNLGHEAKPTDRTVAESSLVLHSPGSGCCHPCSQQDVMDKTQVNVASQNGGDEKTGWSLPQNGTNFNKRGILVKSCHQGLIVYRHTTTSMQTESCFRSAWRQQDIVNKQLGALLIIEQQDVTTNATIFR